MTAAPDDQSAENVARRWRRNRIRAGWRLRDLRVAADLSQVDLAHRSGVWNSLISRYELAQTAPQSDTIRALAGALGVPPAAFVTFPDDGIERPDVPVVRFGEAGRIATNDDGHPQCHLCGEFFAFLGKHIGDQHGVTAAEYRAIAGLKASTRLASKNVREERRELTGRRVGTELFERFRAGGATYQAERATRPNPPRRVSLEERLDAEVRATRLANLAKAHAKQAADRAARPPKPPKPPKPVVAPIERTCPICGRTFVPVRRDRVTCGMGCRLAWDRHRGDDGRAARTAWGKQLRACREAAGITATALAASAGSTVSMLSKLEHGVTGPSQELFERLRRVLPTLPERPIPTIRINPVVEEPK